MNDTSYVYCVCSGVYGSTSLSESQEGLKLAMLKIHNDYSGKEFFTENNLHELLRTHLDDYHRQKSAKIHELYSLNRMSGELFEILSCMDTPEDLLSFINDKTLSYYEMTRLLDNIRSFYRNTGRPEMLFVIDD